MIAQQALFDLTTPAPKKRKPRVIPNASVDIRERRRLSAQAVRVLERIQQSPPPSNFDLVKIALKYSARISEIRQAGYNVVCFDRNYDTGVAYYRLDNGNEKAA